MNIPENTPPLPPAPKPSDTLMPDIPSAWFDKQFPELSKKYGFAVDEENPKGGKITVKDICEDYFAACLGYEGMPLTPTIYLPSEDRFFTYNPEEGIFLEIREADLLAQISTLFLNCARSCQSGADTRKLEFGFRDAGSLVGIIKKAKSLLAKPVEFFTDNSRELICCKNGILRLSDKSLLNFSPDFRFRNKLDADFIPGAKCPVFLEKLMLRALSEPDLALLQRACGQFLTGKNHSQKMIILSGTAGGGKGTFIRVFQGIIGKRNIGSIRTELLSERFEIGGYIGKMVLYGPDVPENFLNCKGASRLKALTGGDPMSIELKGVNGRPEIMGDYNIILTCNSRLIVRLEGDARAWGRRLVIIPYLNNPPVEIISDFSDQILDHEASGVLNWMLQGMEKLRADNWQIKLNREQQKIVDDLLLESESHAVFADENLERDGLETLTAADCHEAYLEFCFARGWCGLAKDRFGKLITDTISRKFAIAQRHDIFVPDGKPVRGWKGLKLKKLSQ